MAIVTVESIRTNGNARDVSIVMGMATPREGVLTGTSQVINTPELPYPCTITLKFATLTTQKIELSTDGGVEYFVPVYDVSTATMRVVTVTAPVSNVKFTGVAGNTWSVR